VIPHLVRTASNAQSLVLAVLPHGGQRSARRNAWASMSQDAVRARARREADTAMSRAVNRAASPGLHGGTADQQAAASAR
jgi:hypothetical protein